MSKVAEKLAAQMAVHLTPDEAVLAVAVVEHQGSAKMMGYFVGGFAGAKIVSSLTKQAKGTASLVPASGRAVWTLTTHRMLFCKATLGGSVGEPISAIRIANVLGVEAKRAKVGTGKLALAFADGSAIGLDLHTGKEADTINRASAALFRPAPAQEHLQGAYQY